MMVQSAQLDGNPAEQVHTKLEDFARTNRRALQITGLVVIAGVAGAVGGFLVVKGITVAKGLAATNLALAANGGTAAKVGATSLPALFAPQVASTVGTASTNPAILNPATAGASVQSITSLLNNAATSSTALLNNSSTFFNFLSSNVLPLTAGLVGGGAAGVGVAQRQVRKVKEQVDEQVLQTATLQAETAQIQRALNSAEGKLSAVEATLATSVQQAESTPTSAPPPIPLTPPDRQDRLEQINGIGPVFAQRLNEAGIYTFAALATQTPEALETIIGTTRAGALFDPRTWIVEAQRIVNEQE